MGLAEIVFYTYLILFIAHVGNCVVERYHNYKHLMTWIETDGVCVVVVALTILIRMMRIFLATFYQTQKTTLATRCAVNKSIGHVGILLISLMVRVAIYLWKWDDFRGYYHNNIISTVIPTCLVFYFLFAAGTEKHCEIKSSNLLRFVDLGHFAFCLLFACPALFIQFRDPEGMKYMILFHLEMFPLCAVSCREVAAVLTNSLVMKKKDESQLEDVKVEKNIEKEAIEQKKEEDEAQKATIYKPLMVFVCA